ncbi:acyl-CoA dehydrogenase [Wenjunlia tyrosinilytica]|uniref:Acyl-CoA dehydrogenase n=1 Tax=Wenjunlia tyrosinilytica TaxID=1544741 RepID=A0A917ZRB8_9ACTN|nr:acyl-CoA dehydrogenase [Wenjunlia tyrosinilytica]GGO89041.1 acyl-CoA dehydrogenase [Wenjunlia tyrosinilytica]
MLNPPQSLGAPPVQDRPGGQPPAGPVEPVDHEEREIQRRIALLESRFGDPREPANPLGDAALLEADARGEMLEAAEDMLRDVGLNAEFVPAELGGRFTRVDTLSRVLRTVFRRDASLGIGYGVSSFLAAVAVWAGGTPRQRRWTADLLLGGGRLAVAYQELAHGNDWVRNEFSAERRGGGYVLHGRKEVINNAERAEALVLFSRTLRRRGSRSHSVFLVDKAALPPGRLAYLPRYSGVGIRGCRMDGLDFDECPVPADAMVGSEGEGVELALRSFQITRSAVPSMVLAEADTCLRTVVSFATKRQLNQRTVLDIPHSRATLAGAFLDLLICDSLALAATRAVHVAPSETSVLAAACKYLLPKILGDTAYDLSTVLGESFYVRSGEFGVFQKHVRDLPVTSLGHAGTAACQATIIPQLPRLARRAWFRDQAVPAALFRPRQSLEPLDYDRLALASGSDSLAASLIESAHVLRIRPGLGHGGKQLSELADAFVAELRRLREECSRLDPKDRSALASPYSYALADRYALVLAAAACLGVWLHHTAPSPGAAHPFIGEPVWVTAALHRLGKRLGLPVPRRPPDVEERVVEEVLARYWDARSFDLYDTPLAG